MLSLYERLLRLRHQQPVLVSGQLTEMSATDGLLQFVRWGGTERFMFVMNLAEEPHSASLAAGAVMASTNLRREGEHVEGTINLQPSEALMIKVTDQAGSAL